MAANSGFPASSHRSTFPLRPTARTTPARPRGAELFPGLRLLVPRARVGRALECGQTEAGPGIALLETPLLPQPRLKQDTLGKEAPFEASVL